MASLLLQACDQLWNESIRRNGAKKITVMLLQHVAQPLSLRPSGTSRSSPGWLLTYLCGTHSPVSFAHLGGY